MSLQNEEKSPILSTASALSLSFSALASAEAVVVLGAVETCFKHEFETPGKMDGG